MKIAFIGDSICVGVGASEDKMRFSSRFVQMLKNDDITAEELNFGIRGSTMFYSGLPDAIPEALTGKPDVVILEHGVNDNVVGSRMGKFLYAYLQAVKIIKQNLPQCKIICMTLCPSYKQHYLYERSWMLQTNIGIWEVAFAEKTLLAETFFMLVFLGYKLTKMETGIIIMLFV